MIISPIFGDDTLKQGVLCDDDVGDFEHRGGRVGCEGTPGRTLDAQYSTYTS